MTEIKTKTITLKTSDYRENDKNILLYTLEHGKLNAVARGIKKAHAKLKFCGEPFCFAETQLANTKGNYTLISATQIESFYELRTDIEKYLGACVVMDSVATLEAENNANSQLFVLIVNTLMALTEDCNVYKVVLKFLLTHLELVGIKPDFSKCSVCGGVTKDMYLDLQLSGTVCDNCRTINSLKVSKSTSAVVSLIDGVSLNKLNNLNITNSQLKECLATLNSYISHSLGKIKSLSELLKL